MLNHSGSAAQPAGGLADAAIILLTKNSQRYLREILEAIYGQETLRSFEVIAVDSGSQDATLAIFSDYPVRVLSIAPHEFNHGETRNFAARHASLSVRYLVFLTHDATPTPGWFEHLLAAVEAGPEVAGAFSRHLPRLTCPPPQARLLAEEWQQSGAPERVLKKITELADYERRRAYYAWFSNTSACIRREVWDAFPFARVDFAEDAQWADRVLRAGYSLVYEPTSTVVHSHDYGLWDQFAQNMDHARGMKRIFGAAIYSTPLSLPAQLLLLMRTMARDVRYIAGQPIPAGRKIYWFLVSPAWHLASHLGTRLGQNYERVPAWLIARISKQERLRALGLRG